MHDATEILPTSKEIIVLTFAKMFRSMSGYIKVESANEGPSVNEGKRQGAETDNGHLKSASW